MAEVQYATKGQSVLNTVLGAVGTAGAVMGNNTLSGIFGGNADPNEKPVTRYEMSLIRESMAKDAEIAALKGKIYTDGKIAGVQGEIAAQAVWNATEDERSHNLQDRMRQLFGMTKLMIPETNIDAQ